MGHFDGTSLERPITCEVCERSLEACTCPRDATGQVTRPQDQPARVQREKRRGKWVTVVTGLDAKASDLPAMLKQYKTMCSAGGTVRDDGVEIQGDHRDRIVGDLKQRGYPAKASGG